MWDLQSWAIYRLCVCLSCFFSLPLCLSFPFSPFPFPLALGLPCSPRGPRTSLSRTWHLSLGRPQAWKCSLRKASQHLLRLLLLPPHPPRTTLVVLRQSFLWGEGGGPDSAMQMGVVGSPYYPHTVTSEHPCSKDPSRAGPFLIYCFPGIRTETIQ